jgi:hypothetical protein
MPAPDSSEARASLEAASRELSAEHVSQMLDRLAQEARAILENRAGPEPQDHPRLLLEAHERFQQRHAFAPGQLVRWKEGLKNKSRPGYGSPGVVMEVLATAIEDVSQTAGSAYYREPLDLVLGLLDSDGGLVVYHYDSRRFEPYEAG